MKIAIAFFFLKNYCRVVWLANSFVFHHIPLLSPLATGHLCTGQIEASTSPRANPGHLTVHRAREGGNLNVDWKGGKFEPDLSLVLA